MVSVIISHIIYLVIFVERPYTYLLFKAFILGTAPNTLSLFTFSYSKDEVGLVACYRSSSEDTDGTTILFLASLANSMKNLL